MDLLLVLWLLAATFLALFLGLIPFGTAIAPACTYVSIIDSSTQVWSTIAGWFTQPLRFLYSDCTGSLEWRIACTVFFLMFLGISLFTPVLACCLSPSCEQCCSGQVYPEDEPEPTVPIMPRYHSPSRPPKTRQSLPIVREGSMMSMQPVMGTAIAMPPARRSLLQPPLLPPPIRRFSLQPPRSALLAPGQRQAWGDQDPLQLQNSHHGERAFERQSLEDRQNQQRSLPPSQQQLRRPSAPHLPSFPTYSVEPSAPVHDPYDYHTWSTAEAEQYHLAASNMQPGSEWRIFYDSAYAAWYDEMYPNWQAQAQAFRQQH